MLNLTEMIIAIRFRLGNKKGIDADIIREINFAQTRLEEDPTIPYWFLVNFNSIVLTVDVKDVPFPTLFLREYDGVLPSLLIEDEYIPLERLDLSEARARYGLTTGQPRAYVIVDNLFQVFPTPDKQYILDFPNIQSQEILADPTTLTNSWTKDAAQMLMNKAGIALSQALRDKDALANFTNDFNVAFAEMTTRVIAREDANMDHQRGGHDDALGSRYR